MTANTIGNENLAIGYGALRSNRGNSRSTAVGYQAMAHADSRTTDARETYNTALGYQALKGIATSSNNTGQYNTALGDQAMNSNSSGYNNTSLGFQALYSNTIGESNTAAGFWALFSNTSGMQNTGIGESALYSNSTGSGNHAFGNYSLFSNEAGGGNVAMGYASMPNNVSGNENTSVGGNSLYYINSDNNTGMGYSAGDYYSFSNGTFIGASAYPNAAGYTNCMAMGYNARATASNSVVIGNSSVTSIGGYAEWTKFSDRRFKKAINEDVPGLAFITQLRPVTYQLDVSSLNRDLDKNNPSTMREGELPRKVTPEEIAGIEAQERIVQTGFIAQAVEAAAKSIGYDFSGVDAPKNENDYYGLRYAEFVVPLVIAVQEQQKIIETQQKEIDELKVLVQKLLEE